MPTLKGVPLSLDVQDDGVRVLRDTPDGPLAELEIPFEGVLRVSAVATSHDPDATEAELVLVHLLLRDPDTELEGVRLGRAPVTVEVPVARAHEVRDVLRLIRRGVTRVHRHRMDLPDLTPPAAVDGRRGPERPDVVATFGRAAGTLSSPKDARVVHAEARPDEYVLEVAPAADRSFLVVTTLRVFIVSPDPARPVLELPVSTVARVLPPEPRGSGVQLRMDDGVEILQVPGLHWQDAERVAGAALFASSVYTTHEAPVPPQPDSRALFHEWEALVQQKELGTVDDETFAREGGGILLALED